MTSAKSKNFTGGENWEIDEPIILERELTTFRPPAGEIESVKILQREDCTWYLKLGISWKAGHEHVVCHYDKRKLKIYSSIGSAVRHVCDAYQYDGRIILFPYKGAPIK